VVDTILPDDSDGSRHQRFILRLATGRTCWSPTISIWRRVLKRSGAGMRSTSPASTNGIPGAASSTGPTTTPRAVTRRAGSVIIAGPIAEPLPGACQSPLSSLADLAASECRDAIGHCRYRPRSWLMSTTLILPLGYDFSVIDQTLQIRSGLRQSLHRAVLMQGVLQPAWRMALRGAA